MPQASRYAPHHGIVSSTTDFTEETGQTITGPRVLEDLARQTCNRRGSRSRVLALVVRRGWGHIPSIRIVCQGHHDPMQRCTDGTFRGAGRRRGTTTSGSSATSLAARCRSSAPLARRRGPAAPPPWAAAAAPAPLRTTSHSSKRLWMRGQTKKRTTKSAWPREIQATIQALWQCKHPITSEVAWPVSPETSSPSRPWRSPELRWSGHLRLRHPRNADLGDALPPDGPASLSPETSSQRLLPMCPGLRWPGHFRLRHPRNSDLGDAHPHGGWAIFA